MNFDDLLDLVLNLLYFLPFFSFLSGCRPSCGMLFGLVLSPPLDIPLTFRVVAVFAMNIDLALGEVHFHAWIDTSFADAIVEHASW